LIKKKKKSIKIIYGDSFYIGEEGIAIGDGNIQIRFKMRPDQKLQLCSDITKFYAEEKLAEFKDFSESEPNNIDNDYFT
jgi:hypothetical protein